MSRKSRILYAAAITAVLCAIAVLLLLWSSAAKTENETASVPMLPDEPDRETILLKRDGLLTEKVTIDTSIISDGLNDMGFLVTEEYYFTEVTNETKNKTIFGFEMPFTESAYMISYDGSVFAGVDFEKIGISANGDEKALTVTLPGAEIQSVEIDYDSFTLYSEKNGLGSRISVTDYNASMKELDANARIKAVDRGVLTRADENARRLIENFIKSLPGTEDYKIVFEVSQSVR